MPVIDLRTVVMAPVERVFDYTAPWGPLGRAADTLFLENYMRRLLLIRNAVIKQAAESHDWKKYLPEAGGR